MITSAACAEFTTETTIIVALERLQREKDGDLALRNGRFAAQQKGLDRSDSPSPFAFR
jgi:hypothetical protein